ncbi:ABC transporter ATP-binding protein [Nonomuraea sp. NPDC059007]|uniref:ABC transporter ATP-binding protein n=1 Tax=Nonomuraea sp. NPDC059007 TaxID=3346692 RepID=UPI00368A6D28
MIVDVRDATVRYRSTGQQVLHGVDLAVERGDFVLVAGPSGCGKSTLLRLLNGLVPHAYRAEVTGRVEIGGRPALEQSIRQLSTVVGTLLQDPAKQIVGTTVATELAFGPENLGLPRAEIRARTDEVAARVGIAHLLARPTHELSGGELQMVAFAGVLVMRPDVVVVDEPLANLDPDAGRRLLGALRRFVDDGGAAVVVEHRVEELLEFGPEKALYLEEGRIRYSGDISGFLRQAPVAHVKLPFETLVARAAELPSLPEPARPARTGPSRLAYKNVSLGYGSRTVLHDTDLDLKADERVAVLGRNGAGKSTLLRAAVRLLEPTGGEILVDGEPVGERDTLSLATTFGYVFQNPGQALFSATVQEELAFGPRNLGQDPEQIAEVSREALATMLLDREPGIMSRPPHTLSHGQQRRLTVALALAMRPRTLVLDEPTAGQDLRTTTTFMDRVLDGVQSVYFITHDVDLALTRADRIVIVDGGRVVADAAPAELAHDERLWTGSGLRETSLVRAVRDLLPGKGAMAKGAIPHPFELARSGRTHLP